jgi:hypothetical protein
MLEGDLVGSVAEVLIEIVNAHPDLLMGIAFFGQSTMRANRVQYTTKKHILKREILFFAHRSV